MNEVMVLKMAYEAIEREFNRISDLLYGQNPLEKYTNNIRGKFNERISSVQILLEQIKDAIDHGNSKEGWDKYVELKTELMPALASELLAVIGGVYLIEAHLDDPQENPAIDERHALSFSDMAKELVKDLASRTGREWASVLIVGEEFFKDSEAEIIRLRFPACDIWNLPFTAHEYGYLVARKDVSTKAFDQFRRWRDKVRENVNPSRHENGSRPKDQVCYLNEVREFWDQYYELPSDNEKQQFLKDHESALQNLADQQITHLCRLYADAFATFFVGPAYVHALLHLRFIPDATLFHPTRTMPAFADRFVFALETLKWMNDTPIIGGTDYIDAFRQEIIATGIPALWKQAVTSSQQEDCYEQIKNRYQPWLEQIKETLSAGFRTKVTIGTTYTNWRESQKFAKELATSPSVYPRPQRWAVLNAAWAARWKKPEAVAQIQLNALKLLNPENTELIKQSLSDSSLLSVRRG